MGERNSTVSSPDGQRWRVRRRWMDRPPPNLRRRFRRDREESDRRDWSDLLWLPDLDLGLSGVAVAVAIAVVAVLVVVVLLPLIGLVLELILFFGLLSCGVLGRTFLRRPWTVEARNVDAPQRSTAYAVKGFRAAGRAAEELARAIAASGPPEALANGEPTTLPRPPLRL